MSTTCASPRRPASRRRFAVPAAILGAVLAALLLAPSRPGAVAVGAAEAPMTAAETPETAAEAPSAATAAEAALIKRLLAGARPDSLTAEQVSLLGRLDARAAPLGRRYPGAPSPESLREIRAAYRELGLDGELMAAVARLAEAADRGVRCAALRALALYGQAGRMEQLREECGAAGHLLHLAVAGDTSAVRVAAERYREARAAGRDAGEERTLGLRDKALLLDVAYYLGTPAGEDFILEVAAGDPDSLARARAEWMIAHPLPGDIGID